MPIVIYSDIVCPWCYVGKRRLERALASVGSDVHVTWRPFQLNPTMPLEGMDRTIYLEAKFGGAEARRAIEGTASQGRRGGRDSPLPSSRSSGRRIPLRPIG